ncbi:MAG: hypothetical protein IJ105_00045 [Bacilli bacterium]|nr:hypothetical protein [Bacilli bacterium]
MKIVLTGNYDNCKTGNLISISGDRGKKVNFDGLCLPKLAPKKDFWQVWHDNIGKISEEENTEFYVTNYYKEVLSKLDPGEIFDSLPEYSILLCYEKNMDFCHRHLVAFWFELFLEIKTYEVEVKPKRDTLQRLDRPEYLKQILEKVIKENYNMNDFNSISAAYHYNKSKEIEYSYKLELKKN